MLCDEQNIAIALAALSTRDCLYAGYDHLNSDDVAYCVELVGFMTCGNI